MAKILVAEDDRAVSAFVARALTHAGHEVVSEPDGLAALTRLAERPFDLLLTDIVMPGLDGIALALKASKDFPDMRILLDDRLRRRAAARAQSRGAHSPGRLQAVHAAGNLRRGR